MNVLKVFCCILKIDIALGQQKLDIVSEYEVPLNLINCQFTKYNDFLGVCWFMVKNLAF